MKLFECGGTAAPATTTNVPVATHNNNSYATNGNFTNEVSKNSNTNTVVTQSASNNNYTQQTQNNNSSGFSQQRVSNKIKRITAGIKIFDISYSCFQYLKLCFSTINQVRQLGFWIIYCFQYNSAVTTQYQPVQVVSQQYQSQNFQYSNVQPSINQQNLQNQYSNVPQNQVPQNQVPQNQVPQTQVPQNQLLNNQVPQTTVPKVQNIKQKFKKQSSTTSVGSMLNKFTGGMASTTNNL